MKTVRQLGNPVASLLVNGKKLFAPMCLLILMAGVLMAGPALAGDEQEIDFFDSGSFDRKLSATLNADPPSVKVSFPAPISVNKIPQRLDKWFAMVEKYEGTVELKVEGEPTRGIVGAIIDLIIGVYEIAKEKITYGPVEDYNAVIYYEKGSGTITRVIFIRKDQAAG